MLPNFTIVLTKSNHNNPRYGRRALFVSSTHDFPEELTKVARKSAELYLIGENNRPEGSFVGVSSANNGVFRQFSDGKVLDLYGNEVDPIGGLYVRISRAEFITLLQEQNESLEEGDTVVSVSTGRKSVLSRRLRGDIFLTECGRITTSRECYILRDAKSINSILVYLNTFSTSVVGSSRGEVITPSGNYYEFHERDWQFSFLTYLIGDWKKCAKVTKKQPDKLDLKKLLEERKVQFAKKAKQHQAFLNNPESSYAGIAHCTFLVDNKGGARDGQNPYSVVGRIQHGGPCHAFVTHTAAKEEDVLALRDHIPMGKLEEEDKVVVKEYLTYLYNDSFISYVFNTKDIDKVLEEGQDLDVEKSCTELMIGLMLSRFITEQSEYRNSWRFALENGASPKQALLFANLVGIEYRGDGEERVFLRSYSHQIFYGDYPAARVNRILAGESFVAKEYTDHPYRTHRTYNIRRNIMQKGETFLERGLGDVLNKPSLPFQRNKYTLEDAREALGVICNLIDA